VITQDDSGRVLRLALGAHTTLHLSGKWSWTGPRVDGRAIELVQINYFRNPGFSAWSIDARKAGTAHIRSSGSPNCRACSRRPRHFSITIVVAPRSA
jgi:hypothetical protein